MRVLRRLQKSKRPVYLVILLILLQLAGSRLDHQRIFLAITSLRVVALHTAELELLMLRSAFILLQLLLALIVFALLYKALTDYLGKLII